MQAQYDPCAICEEDIEGYGHNGAPVTDGRVCDLCNQFIVIPKRIGMHILNVQGKKGVSDEQA